MGQPLWQGDSTRRRSRTRRRRGAGQIGPGTSLLAVALAGCPLAYHGAQAGPEATIPLQHPDEAPAATPAFSEAITMTLVVDHVALRRPPLEQSVDTEIDAMSHYVLRQGGVSPQPALAPWSLPSTRSGAG